MAACRARREASRRALRGGLHGGGKRRACRGESFCERASSSSRQRRTTVTSAERAAAAARSRRLGAPWRGEMFGLRGSRQRYDFYESPESSDLDDVDDAGLPWAWHDAAADADAAAAADDVAEAEPRAVHAADERAPYLDLPLPLLRALLAGLPVDVRLRCREVCPGWRDVLRPAALWADVDISNRSGVAALPTEAFMHALSRASGHRMAALHAHGGALLSRTLRRVVSSNARTLRRVDITTGKPALQQMRAQRAAVQRALAVGDFASVLAAASATMMTRDLPELRCVARAGPALEALHVDVRAGARHATLLLRNQYGPLRARTLNAQAGFVDHGVLLDDPRASRVAHIAEALPMHPSLRRLELTSAQLAPDNRAADAQAAADDPHVVAFGMLCDALAALPAVDELVLSMCTFCAASQAHLARLLGAGTLRYMTLCGGSGYGAPAGADGEEAQAPPLARPEPALAAGLRGSSLARLTLTHVRLFDNAASAGMLRALAGHATLRTLDVHDNEARGARACLAAGAALAAVLAADGLEELNCDSCKLGGEAMAPLFAALGAATRLRMLSVACNGLGERDVTLGLAPALSSCALEELRVRCGDCDGACSAAYAAGQAAEAEVAARARARGYVPFGGWPDDDDPPAADEEEEEEEEEEWEEVEDGEDD